MIRGIEMMTEGTIGPVTIREIGNKVEVILATDLTAKTTIMGAGAKMTTEGVMIEVLDLLRTIEKTEIDLIKTIETVTGVVKTIGLVISEVVNREVRTPSSHEEEEAGHFVVGLTREEDSVANFRDNLSNRWSQKAELYQSRLTYFE